jgi:hypothetical protein
MRLKDQRPTVPPIIAPRAPEPVTTSARASPRIGGPEGFVSCATSSSTSGSSVMRAVTLTSTRAQQYAVWMLRGRPVVTMAPHSAAVAAPNGGSAGATKL